MHSADPSPHARLGAGLGVGITIQVGEQVYEFLEALRRTGRTPVGLLAEHGLLGPDTILGHCRYVGGDSQTAHRKFDLSPLVTHSLRIDEIGAAYEICRDRREEEVFKVGIRPYANGPSKWSAHSETALGGTASERRRAWGSLCRCRTAS